MRTGLPLHRAGITLPAKRQSQKLTAQNSKVRTPSAQSTKASPSPHSLISYSWLPFLFLGVLVSIPTSSGIRNKREPGYPVQCYSYVPPKGMHVHPTPVKIEDSKTWDQFQFGLLVPGKREGREGCWPSDPMLTICKSLSWHPPQASWSVCWGWWSSIWLKQHPLPHCMQHLG